MTGRAQERVRGTKAGFTLVELLAAIVVLGFVVVMLSEGLRFGVHAERLVAEEHRADLLAVDGTLRRIVELADPGIYPEPATLRGTAHVLSLTTALPTGGVGLPQRADVVLASVNGQLVLRWRPHLHAEWFGPGPAWTETVLCEGVAELDLAYFASTGSSGWSSSWDGEQLPSFVRLTLGFSGQNGQRWPPTVVATRREPLEE